MTVQKIVKKLAQQIVNCFYGGGTVWVFGNGGSLADASHWAAEFNGIGPVIALNDLAKITSIGNDEGFEFIFSRQIKDLGKPYDLAIGISSSGKSKNVTNALNTAKMLKVMYTIDWPRHKIPTNPKEVAEVQNKQYKLMHDVYLEVRKQINADN